MSFATTAEIECFARLTLKEFGLADYEVVFLPRLTRRLGQSNPWEKKIELSPQCLSCFSVFSFVLKHEILHALDFIQRGGTFKNEKGRNDFHGKSFKALCKKHNLPFKMRIAA